MTLAQEIKEYSLNIGFARVGIIPAENDLQYLGSIKERGNHYDWLNAPAIPLCHNTIRGSQVKDMAPTAKSIVVMAYDYRQKAFPQNLLNMIGDFYLGRAYVPPAGSMNKARIDLMIDFLKGKGCEISMDIAVPARVAAAKAGIATFGRNTLAYVDGIGSYVCIYTLPVDKELEYDTPTLDNRCPPKCFKCKDACPTGAIYEPFKMNPHKCIPFSNWMALKTVDREILPKIGARIHGCNECQDVCPRNQKRLKATLPEDPFLTMLSQDINLKNILAMPKNFYETRIYPIMYNYIAKPRFFQRNAAIAIGNSGDEKYLPVLEKAMSDPAPVVREYTAWALGRIGGAKAKQILTKHQEADETVLKEIKTTLEYLAAA